MLCPAVGPADAGGTKKTVIRLPADVLFAFGSAELTPAAEHAIAAVDDEIGSGGTGTVRIEGHTDAIGSDADNQALSERRAAAVRAALEAELGSGYQYSSIGFRRDGPDAGAELTVDGGRPGVPVHDRRKWDMSFIYEPHVPESSIKLAYGSVSAADDRAQAPLVTSDARTLNRSGARPVPVATSAAMSPISGANLAPCPEQGETSVMPSTPSMRKSSSGVLVNRQVVSAYGSGTQAGQELPDVVHDPRAVRRVDDTVLVGRRRDPPPAEELGDLLPAEPGVAATRQAVGPDRGILVDERRPWRLTARAVVAGQSR